MCSWAAINAALIAKIGAPWTAGAFDLLESQRLSHENYAQLLHLWLYGKLIANTDMHDGNLSFTPGLQLAPAYDMLPMAYAPARGMDLQDTPFQPVQPLPSERQDWTAAAQAPAIFWQTAEQDQRISNGFWKICVANAMQLGAR